MNVSESDSFQAALLNRRDAIEVWIMDGRKVVSRMSPDEFRKATKGAGARNAFLSDIVSDYNDEMEKAGSSQIAKQMVRGIDFK